MFIIFHKPGIRDGSGFTLIELTIIIVVLAVIATFGIPVMGDMITASKIASTKKELSTLKIAIAGKSGSSDIRGYENDVGSPPPDLQGLFIKPEDVAEWNRFARTGWNGPYIEGDNGSYLKDSWGIEYDYDPSGRTIKSVGGPDTITVVF